MSVPNREAHPERCIPFFSPMNFPVTFSAEQQRFWFAARVKHCQEFAVRNALQKFGIECYIPTRPVIRELRNRRMQVEVPVIRNLIFVHAAKAEACAAANYYGIPLYYVRDLHTRSMLVVPDKQMEDFMLVMRVMQQQVAIGECPLAVGCKVLVVKGELCGVEGELVGEGNRTHVRIRIPQILSATVRIPRSYLRVRKE